MVGEAADGASGPRGSRGRSRRSSSCSTWRFRTRAASTSPRRSRAGPRGGARPRAASRPTSAGGCGDAVRSASCRRTGSRGRASRAAAARREGGRSPGRARVAGAGARRRRLPRPGRTTSARRAPRPPRRWSSRWAFLAAGLVAWARRPGEPGRAADARGRARAARPAAALQPRRGRSSPSSSSLGDLGYVLVAHSVLAYPSGRLTGRVERVLVKAGVRRRAALVPLADPRSLHDKDGRLRQFDPSPRRSLIVVSGHDAAGAVPAGVVPGRAVRRARRALRRCSCGGSSWHATPRLRRILLPLARRRVRDRRARACSRASSSSRGTGRSPRRRSSGGRRPRSSRCRSRCSSACCGRGSRGPGSATSCVELEHTPPAGLRDALARALGDPSLELAFWLPEQGEYVDAGGARVELPGAGTRVAP